MSTSPSLVNLKKFLAIFVVLSIVEVSILFLIQPVLGSILIVVTVTLSLVAAAFLVREIFSIIFMHVVMIAESILQAHIWWTWRGADRIAFDLVITVTLFPIFVLFCLTRTIVALWLQQRANSKTNLDE